MTTLVSCISLWAAFSFVVALDQPDLFLHPPLSRFPRRRRVSSRACSNDPWLWSIRKGPVVVGYGVGTMHLPVQAVAPGSRWTALVNAAKSSCRMYVEWDYWSGLESRSARCPAKPPLTLASSIMEYRPTDLLSHGYPELYQSLEQMLTEKYIQIELPDAQTRAKDYLKAAGDLLVVRKHFLSLNSPLTRPLMLGILNGKVHRSLDQDLIYLGRPTLSVEHPRIRCEIMAAFRRDYMNASAHLELESDRAGFEAYFLKDVYTDQVSQYTCGDVTDDDRIPDFWAAPTVDLNNGRDKQMAEHFDHNVRDLHEAPSPVFGLEWTANAKVPPVCMAVGLAHWTWGNYSLLRNLAARGYTISRETSAFQGAPLPDGNCPEYFYWSPGLIISAIVLPAVLCLVGSLVTSLCCIVRYRGRRGKGRGTVAPAVPASLTPVSPTPYTV